MKFTQQQIEAFRYSYGITYEGAEEAMQEVACLVETLIRADIDQEALRDGDSFYQGMDRAADIANDSCLMADSERAAVVRQMADQLEREGYKFADGPLFLLGLTTKIRGASHER